MRGLSGFVKKMPKRYKLLIGAGLLMVAAAFVWWFFSRRNIAVLNPSGTIASDQRDLIMLATGLGLLVVLPVFAMTAWIAINYREGNAHATYKPDWDHSRLAETLWWGIPFVIILILSVVTWQSSHSLDPFKPLASSKKALPIQVIALDWKWLFIYPNEKIATVNYLKIPEDTPINFEITADAPMNSLWIPQLGGQIYAMAGMSTQLHLMADKPGSYQGSSANLSGKGFSGMRFKAIATSETDYQQWVKSVRQSPARLGLGEYYNLSQPSEPKQTIDYAFSEPGLYDSVIAKYMGPMSSTHDHGAMY